MTRVLSELLGANPLDFSSAIQKLEGASGHDNIDIRLSSDINHATRQKIRQLGLDPADTTGPELYAALMQRFTADDEHLQQVLRERHTAGEPATDMQLLGAELEELPINTSCFALKTTVAKRLLKKLPPKHAMKALGYRSLDSFLKHEPLPAIFAATKITESATWQKQLHEQYKKLTPADFEMRPLHIFCPVSKKWQRLVEKQMSSIRHTVMPLYELGAMVLLGLPSEQPPAVITTTLLFGIHTINELQAASTFLKLSQVRSDFGQQVLLVATGEPAVSAQVFGRDVPWHVVQRYYARFADRFKAELFEPHIQVEDLTWHSIEKILRYIDPQIDFWQHTTHLSLLHDHQPVSMNIMDVALNCCNRKQFGERFVHYFRSNLWQELMIRYLKHENVERLVLDKLESELVSEPVMIE